MRTNIDIDDALLAEAMAVTGLPTKKATVEEALRHLLRSASQRQAMVELAALGGSEPDLRPVPRRRGIGW